MHWYNKWKKILLLSARSWTVALCQTYIWSTAGLQYTKQLCPNVEWYANINPWVMETAGDRNANIVEAWMLRDCVSTHPFSEEFRVMQTHLSECLCKSDPRLVVFLPDLSWIFGNQHICLAAGNWIDWHFHWWYYKAFTDWEPQPLAQTVEWSVQT